MQKTYNHREIEGSIYAMWEQGGYFKPKTDQKKKPFCIIMPPPNANDPLHIGHAMFVTIEDVITRYHRMKGDETLWLPGTDHAGIETQYVFEKKLKAKGKSRFDYDRKTLFKMIWDYVQENSLTAIKQMKRLGASADWSRTKFTLDKDIVKIVLETFKELCDKDLVYRGEKLVNYCTRCGTAFSDLEIKHIERKTPLYYMKYGPFTLATTRPETKFGDTALAVHPEDERYQKYINTEFEAVGLLGKFTMKVIADKHVDPKFGTGVVKITPAHDKDDFEVWQRHQKEIPGPKQVINFDGKLNKLAGKYASLRVNEARKKVVADLDKKGLLVKVDKDYTHNIGVCYRCNTVVEPLPLPQFFIKVKSLTQEVLKALKEKKVRVYGAGYDKVLVHWLKNLKDWNISRQIVWGIRMPVWYPIKSKKNAKIIVAFFTKNRIKITGHLKDVLQRKISLEEINQGLQELKAPIDAEYEISLTCPGKDYLQETDTFDTWFSSAQWPFATLRASQYKNDFKRFYPTSVMETGYDILPFWVMRMLMVGLFKTQKVPFKEVYLHGLVRDEKGQKMSKSKGNVINPLDVSQKYGADALRIALVMSTTAGTDNAVGEAKIRGMRNLTNKIWNAARFIFMSLENPKQTHSPKLRTVTILEGENKGKKIKITEDEYFLKTLNQIIKDITQQLDDLKIGLAAETAYRHFWHWFCDEQIEKCKKGEISLKVLIQGFKTFLKLLHPFIPFITEELWQKFTEEEQKSGKEKLLIISSWPKAETQLSFRA